MHGGQRAGRGGAVAHRDVQVHAALVFVVADQNRLDAYVGDVDGAREEEEDGEAGEQQAQQHRGRHVQLPGDSRTAGPAGGAMPTTTSLNILPRDWPINQNRLKDSAGALRPPRTQPLVAVGDQRHQLVLLAWNTDPRGQRSDHDPGLRSPAHLWGSFRFPDTWDTSHCPVL